MDIDMAEVELDKLVVHFAQSNKAEVAIIPEGPLVLTLLH